MKKGVNKGVRKKKILKRRKNLGREERRFIEIGERKKETMNAEGNEK